MQEYASRHINGESCRALAASIGVNEGTLRNQLFQWAMRGVRISEMTTDFWNMTLKNRLQRKLDEYVASAVRLGVLDEIAK